jgi:hypothetical protein
MRGGRVRERRDWAGRIRRLRLEVWGSGLESLRSENGSA